MCHGISVSGRRMQTAKTHRGAVLPTMLNVVIVAGQTATKTVVLGGPYHAR
jgi:hypothetical protein